MTEQNAKPTQTPRRTFVSIISTVIFFVAATLFIGSALSKNALTFNYSFLEYTLVAFMAIMFLFMTLMLLFSFATFKDHLIVLEKLKELENLSKQKQSTIPFDMNMLDSKCSYTVVDMVTGKTIDSGDLPPGDINNMFDVIRKRMENGFKEVSNKAGKKKLDEMTIEELEEEKKKVLESADYEKAAIIRDIIEMKSKNKNSEDTSKLS